MPEAVRITLWLDASVQSKRQAETPALSPMSEEQAATSTESGLEATNTAIPLEFQTVVRLNLAANAQSSSGGSDNSDQSSPGAAAGGNQ